MRIEISKKLFTVDDYYRMAEAGILTEDDRVELIDGEILQMSAIGSSHLGCVNRASTLFVESFGRRCVVSTQNPVQLSVWTEPQPDIVVLKPRADFYASKKPMAEDVLFIAILPKQVSVHPSHSSAANRFRPWRFPIISSQSTISWASLPAFSRGYFQIIEPQSQIKQMQVTGKTLGQWFMLAMFGVVLYLCT